MRGWLRHAGVVMVAAWSIAGCSDDGADATTDVKLHAEAPVLPDFSYDTGLRPASGPAQVSLKLAAGGAIAVDAVGAVSGGKLQAKPGEGRLALDMHVKLEGRLKVDAGTIKYDGDLPGVKNIDIPIGAETKFDGFAMSGDPAQVVSNVPETKLPDIPLGTVPGHLTLTVAGGSQITTAYRSTCLQVQSGNATLKGETITSGTLVLKVAVVLDVPLFKKTIDLPEVSVDIPQSTKPLDVTAAVAGLADGTTGTCGASASSDESGGGAEEGGATARDGGSSQTGSCEQTADTGIAACNECIGGSCCAELTACADDSDCYSFMECIKACTSSTSTCEDTCKANHAAGAATYDKIIVCARKSCRAACR